MTGTAWHAPHEIPEAIPDPWGLSLAEPWLGTHGPHLTLQASEDYKAPTYGGPVTLPFPE
ncbi:hypothetical protein GCM10022211_18680 [Sphingomonas humi]|uniref:Uncharacterized protein n=1 Tax=Sphingomonas humi TaxID=335630 RepID=A0ABP7S3V8_9SPHN